MLGPQEDACGPTRRVSEGGESTQVGLLASISSAVPIKSPRRKRPSALNSIRTKEASSHEARVALRTRLPTRL